MILNSRLAVGAEGSNTSVISGKFSGGSSTRGGFFYAEGNVRVKIAGGLVANNVATDSGGAVGISVVLLRKHPALR